jgi:hypothetical protein
LGAVSIEIAMGPSAGFSMTSRIFFPSPRRGPRVLLKAITVLTVRLASRRSRARPQWNRSEIVALPAARIHGFFSRQAAAGMADFTTREA